MTATAKIQATPSPAGGLSADPVFRHLLRQVGIIGAEMRARQDQTVVADGDAAASIGSYLALEDADGALPLLRAQLTAMHEIAMAALSRAAANWADAGDHHRNVWDAVRACGMFMRQMDAYVRVAARARKAEKAAEKAADTTADTTADQAAANDDAPREDAPRHDVNALARQVMGGVMASARAARKARDEDLRERRARARGEKWPPEELSDEEYLRQREYHDHEIAKMTGQLTGDQMRERIAELEKMITDMGGTPPPPPPPPLNTW